MSEFVLAKVEIEETAATIAAERRYVGLAVEAIKRTRNEIERQIRRDDFFLTTLEPYEPDKEAGRVIERMCTASRAATVGPMATVAGTIAQEALEAMIAEGCTHCWVDNGGDVAIMLEKPATMEIFSEPGSDSAAALDLEPTNGIIGICTSSGKLGHSISFGNSDAAVAIAKDALLADALATAIGNRVKDIDSLSNCFDDLKQVSGFIGGLAMIGGSVAMCGKMPRMVEVEHNPDRITVHSRMSSTNYTGKDARKSEVGA